MKRSILLFPLGLLCGSASVWFWHQAVTERSHTAKLLDREAQIAQLNHELAGARTTAEAWRQSMERSGVDPDPVKENVLDIQRILNDARPLMKSLALMFGERRKEMSGRMIRSMANKLAEQMGLTEEQTEAMIAHFVKLDAENFEKLKSMFDRKLTIFDVFTVMNDMNPQKAMDAYVKQSMTPEQMASWENRKLETKAEQLERTANWQLDRMSRSLNLDEIQKDQVFDILVKTNPAYDASLAVTGVTGTETAGAPPLNQDEAIAGILREEQLDGWTAYRARQDREKNRMSDALGGMDPATFFRSLGGLGRIGNPGRQ